MACYWCAFRLAADKAYRARYEALLKAIFALRGKNGASWSEASYFVAFNADASLDNVARALREAIDPDRDVLVVGLIGGAAAIAMGPLQHGGAFAALFPQATYLD